MEYYVQVVMWAVGGKTYPGLGLQLISALVLTHHLLHVSLLFFPHPNAAITE